MSSVPEWLVELRHEATHGLTVHWSAWLDVNYGGKDGMWQVVVAGGQRRRSTLIV